MNFNTEQLSEQEIREKISEINRKIDEELLDSEKADMALVDEYLRQLKELDGMSATSEEKLDEELRLLYEKADQKKQRKTYFAFCTVGRRVAAVLIVVGLFSMLSVVICAARSPYVQALFEKYDKYIEIFFDPSDIENAPSEIETVYTLGYVPEGYELKSQSVDAYSVSFCWSANGFRSIEFEQYILDGKIQVDHEQSEILRIEEDGIYIYCKEAYGLKSYYWNTNEYQFRLYIEDEDISTEEGIELVRSIVKYQK